MRALWWAHLELAEARKTVRNGGPWSQLRDAENRAVIAWVEARARHLILTVGRPEHMFTSMAPEGYSRVRPKQHSVLPCPEWSQWEQDLRDYFLEREQFLVEQGVDAAEARKHARFQVQAIHLERVRKREAELAQRSREEREASIARRKQETEAFNKEWGDTVSTFKGKRRR